MAAKMHPGSKIQIETDYLGVGGPWQYGHAGLSDYRHKYWLLVFQIAMSESEDAVYELLDYTIKLAENVHVLNDLPLEDEEELLMSAHVTQVLADGADCSC
jgi:hypothetical protein